MGSMRLDLSLFELLCPAMSDSKHLYIFQKYVLIYLFYTSSRTILNWVFFLLYWKNAIHWND